MHRHLGPIGPNYTWYKVFSIYYVIHPPSDGLGFAVYSSLCPQVIGLRTFKCSPMTNWMWHSVVLNVTILSLANLVKFRPNSSYMAWNGTKLSRHVPVASSSSFSLAPVWSLLAPCILFLLCSVSPHIQIELGPLTGFHKKSTLSILWFWWSITLWSTTFHHPHRFILPSFLSGTSRQSLPLLHSGVVLSHIYGYEGATFHPAHSSRMVSSNTAPFLREIWWKKNFSL